MYNGFCITVFNFLNDHTLLQFSSFGRAHAFGLFRTFDLWIDFVYEQKKCKKDKNILWAEFLLQTFLIGCHLTAGLSQVFNFCRNKLSRLDASWIPLGIPHSLLPCACWPDSLSPSFLQTCYAGQAWQKEYNLTLQ